MLSALIIILREVLEAGLIIGVLLATAQVCDTDRRGIGLGVVLGAMGALANAHWMAAISDSFGGIGQELLNAGLLLGIGALLACYNIGIGLRGRNAALAAPLLLIGAAGAVTCSISRECAEIFIYAASFATDFATFTPILIGGAIGAGIGASIAALLYSLLVYLPARGALLATALVPGLIAGGMAAEAISYLAQSGLVSSSRPLWDTSAWLAENSLQGQLLYALIGYEATPTRLQVGAYLGALVLVGASGLLRLRSRGIEP